MERVYRNITDEELLDDLRKVFNESGGYFSLIVYDEVGKFGYAIFRKRFGSWDHAKNAAGLKQLKVDIIKDELLFQNLEDVCLKLGRQPKYDEIKVPLSQFSAAVYIGRFGTWRDALDKFVEFERSIRSGGLDERYYLDAKRLKVPHQFLIAPTVQELQHDKRSSFGTLTKSGLGSQDIKSEDTEEMELYESLQERLFESLNSDSYNYDIYKDTRRTNRAPNARLRNQVLKRDNYRCVFCGRSPAKDLNVELHVDHIKPWSKGGETVLENLQTLCATCNLGKSNIE